jgi:hypothetical protein
MRLASLVLPLLVIGCGMDVGSTADAQRAYQGLETSVERAISLSVSSLGNAAARTAKGRVSGALRLGEPVQHDSAGARFLAALSRYSDDGEIVYSTDPDAPPAVTLDVRNVSRGALDGTIEGSFLMSGAERGQVSLLLAFSTAVAPGPGGALVRRPGTTRITGTATSPSGAYHVDVIR